MTEEKFRKSLIITGVLTTISLILIIGLGIFVFNDSEKRISIFENDKQRSDYNMKTKESETEISEDEIKEIKDNKEFNTDTNENVN